MYSTHLHEVDPAHVVLPGHRYIAAMGVRCFEVGHFESLQEKAAIIRFPLERIAKTIYFQHNISMPIHGNQARLYGAVVPASCMVNSEPLSALAGVSKLPLAKVLPYGMTRGSCGPFLMHEDAIEGITQGDQPRPVVKAILYDLSLEDVVDFSVPGKPHFSLQAPAGEVIAHLRQMYPCIVLNSDIRKERHATAHP